MRKTADPRVVVVTRKTPLDLLLQRHGTKGQAKFFLRSRAQSIEGFESVHQHQQDGVAHAIATLPADRRRTRVDRDDLDRFVFEDDDVVLAVGQDGLVANVAKYLTGQPVIGVNPDPRRYDGVLCTVPPALAWTAVRYVLGEVHGFAREARQMVEVVREDGQRLLGLNEIFLGHRTHQSAVYRLRTGDSEERQSSSGIIVSTGTGATGWARSIARQRGLTDALPAPGERKLAWFVREPFPSVATGVDQDFGLLGPGEELMVTSEMGDDGAIFADGIETDRVEFSSGQIARVRVSETLLELVRWVRR